MSNDITNRELFEALTKLHEKNGGLIAYVIDAVANLKKTESKLDAAKALYEKPILYPIKKAFIQHPKFSIVAFLLMVALLLGSLVCIFKDKDFSYKDQNREAEAKTKINQP